MVGEEDGGNPRAACIRGQKEKVVQTKVQVGVQDVSSYGGKSKKVAAFSVACSARGSDEGTEEGDGEGSLVCRGQEVGANMSSISRLGGHRHGLGGFRSESFGSGHLDPNARFGASFEKGSRWWGF